MKLISTSRYRELIAALLQQYVNNEASKYTLPTRVE